MRKPRLPDAAVRRARPEAAVPARELPRSEQGRQVASRRRISSSAVVAVAAVLAAGCGGGTTTKTTVDLNTGTESLVSENVQQVPRWGTENRLPRAALPGARLFAQIGCLNCHSYLGTGGGYKGALDLSKEGLRHRGLRWQIRHLRCPSCAVKGSPMPTFAALGTHRIQALAVFLEASRGGK